MDSKYTPEQLAFKDSARQFIQTKMAPGVDECDRKSVFPAETFRAFGKQGFLGVIVPKQYGGLGMGTMEYCLLSEEIGRLSAGYHHNNLFQTQKMLLSNGTEQQKEKYLQGLASGELHAATAISEPGMGSSFSRMGTRAVETDGGYVINGVKSHINDAAEADVLNVFAATPEGTSIFLLEKETPGFKITGKLDPIGMRASPIYEFELDDCFISKENLLGNPGDGTKIFINTFNFSRLGNASVFLGTAKAALGKAVSFAAQRKVREHAVTDYQGIRWMIADLATRIKAAELLRNRGAVLVENNSDHEAMASMAKLYCGETAVDVVRAAIKICGSFGCYRDQPFERWLRDVAALEIAGGTPEVMKNIIINSVMENYKVTK
jgi:alkylation response protein AidB-like acyl-CoA dehydrogenase